MKGRDINGVTPDVRFGIGRVTRFFLPLLIQGFTQSLTYPLVAGIVTHGPLGVNALTAFSQGVMIMFMIGSLGAGLITTGLVFAKTWRGYAAYKRLNRVMMAVLLALQCLPALPPFGNWLFEGFFALPSELAWLARGTLLLGVVMNAGFFARNEPMILLFNRLESGKANNATMIRILVTLICSQVFPRWGWTGPWWGLTALTLGVWIETGVTWYYARNCERELPNQLKEGERPDWDEIAKLTFEQFKFAMPLSLGGFLLSLSPLIMAAFLGRTANAVDMLAIHYVTIGVANPVAYGALKLQSVAVKFPPEYEGDRRLLLYSVVSGLLLGLLPLAFRTSLLGDWYFGVYQNVPDRLLATCKTAIGLYSLFGVFQSVRAWIEGVAGARKDSFAVMAGQIAYTLSLLATCGILLRTGCPGWCMAVSAILLAPLMTTLTIGLVMRRRNKAKGKEG